MLLVLFGNLICSLPSFLSTAHHLTLLAVQGGRQHSPSGLLR